MTIRLILTFLILQITTVIALFADPSTAGPVTEPSGQPIQVELLVVLALVAFILFKLFGLGNTPPPPPPPPPPKAKGLLQQVHEAIGGMEEVGDKTYVGGKLVASKGDKETYLVMAQVDKSHIRKQERAKAQEAYQKYEQRIFYLKIVVGLFAVFVLAITHETLIEWGTAIYEFFSGLFASSPDATSPTGDTP